MKVRHKLIGYGFILLFSVVGIAQKNGGRIINDFNTNWSFKLGDYPKAIETNFEDSDWRKLQLPHDWSIEGEFSSKHPTRAAQGALPAGIGWYRKTFMLPQGWTQKSIIIEFDGVFKNSEVWINGHLLGKRPNGYISFMYDLTKYLYFGKKKNIIAVKVDNDAQPNSRWYTGSGIYRNVKLVVQNKVHIAHWGTYVTTPKVTNEKASVRFETTLSNSLNKTKTIILSTTIVDDLNQPVTQVTSIEKIGANSTLTKTHVLQVKQPKLWGVNSPYLYKVVTKVFDKSMLIDNYETPLGIRYFDFNADKGFSLNGVSTKILGVCLHHDNGALGAVENIHAVKRKLKLLKQMGANAIRISHNPPSLELLQLCDEMGFIVQDEAFDVWKKKKVAYDYHKDWDQWHKKDLEDFIKRDRNHPSIMMWSIGNEIREQFDSTGIEITKELTHIVKSLDITRPITCALTENEPSKNYIFQSKALDLLGFNYKHTDYQDFPVRFKGQKIIASESVSAIATRGQYDQPSDILKVWPTAYNLPFDGNKDLTASAYDQTIAYWGATHEATWKTIKKQDFMAGLFVWTGFDYLGEPDPYTYPARSSYFGIIDLAGLPKDIYYMYQSEWTSQPVLHIFPHWNWQKGQEVDVWAYYNQADEVELFLNGKSMGIKSKQNDDLHVFWRLQYEPGVLKAISRKNGIVVLEKEIQTASAATLLELVADKKVVKKDGYDLTYITVLMKDRNGNLVPNANHLINFQITGGGKIVGVDNGYQAGLDSFKTNSCKLFNGKCIVIIQSNTKNETIKLTASSEEQISNCKIEIRVE